MLSIDLHVHSIASGHALNTVYELAETAGSKGLSMIGIADHCSNMEGAPHLGYFEVSARAPDSIRGIRVLMGCELNILDIGGTVDLPHEILKLQKIVFASLHKRTTYAGQTVKDHTAAIINAMSNPYVLAISHPFRPEFPVDMEEVVRAASKRGVILEVNCQALTYHRTNNEMIANTKSLIQLAQNHGVPLLISSDAHTAEEIGEDAILDELHLRSALRGDFILNRSMEAVLEFLERREAKLRNL